jgi:8-oxo-dGTP pyrophosphatase MutT (NUDIX family)
VQAIRYEAAGGVVIDHSGRVLVLCRPSRGEVRLPKGHVEKGESHLEAARREVAEESGYSELRLLADLGHQVVKFEYRGRRIVRDEYYFLLQLQDASHQVKREARELQFEPAWIGWEQALMELSFESEREWVRRARAASNAGPDAQAQ